MKRYLYIILLLFPVLSVLGPHCSSSQTAGGGTIETTNGVVGSLRNQDDTPACGVVVELFSSDYDPVADDASDGKYSDTTDAKGNFRFRRLGSGLYNIVARDRALATCFLAADISVGGDTVTTLSEGTLEMPGVVTADFSVSPFPDKGYLYIPGTDIFSYIGNDGTAFMGNVPAGVFSEIIFNSDSLQQRNILREEVTVLPQSTVTIANPLWKHSRSIVLNTSATGAAVSGDVYGFAVLLRFNTDNFDFSEAAQDGSDMLFLRNGYPLPFEIERWDAVLQHAELWVKVDTIFGDDSVQSIDMYWGNSGAMNSSSSSVFDVADGFEGVWHLGEAEDGLVRDATENGYDGVTSPQSQGPQPAQGVIGRCREFDGVDDFITMPNTASGRLDFPESGTYTVSAWVKIDSFGNASHCIVSKGYEQYYLRSTYVTSIPGEPLWEFVEFSESAKWQVSSSPAKKDGLWTLLTGVRQGGRQFLYCNGDLADSTFDSWVNGESRFTGNDLTIGRFMEEVTLPLAEGYCHFRGKIDEVRISARAPSPDWIRLCYMNQRIDDCLIVFR